MSETKTVKAWAVVEKINGELVQGVWNGRPENKFVNGQPVIIWSREHARTIVKKHKDTSVVPVTITYEVTR